MCVLVCRPTRVRSWFSITSSSMDLYTTRFRNILSPRLPVSVCREHKSATVRILSGACCAWWEGRLWVSVRGVGLGATCGSPAVVAPCTNSQIYGFRLCCVSAIDKSAEDMSARRICFTDCLQWHRRRLQAPGGVAAQRWHGHYRLCVSKGSHGYVCKLKCLTQYSLGARCAPRNRPTAVVQKGDGHHLSRKLPSSQRQFHVLLLVIDF